jgi:hypothetical protein
LSGCVSMKVILSLPCSPSLFTPKYCKMELPFPEMEVA